MSAKIVGRVRIKI